MNVYLEVDGKPIPARELTWAHFSPCGCQCGVLVAQSGNFLVPDEESAWKEFYESAAIRNREKTRGYTFKLMHHPDAVVALGGKCPHTPQWGVPDETAPQGFAWARKSKAKLLHLVPYYGDPEKRHYLTAPSYNDTVSTRCGQENYSWDIDPWERSEYLTCGKCAATIGAAA